MKMIYKAITLYQPWASLWAVQAKLYETRTWQTRYRGPIAIHAGLNFINSFPEEFGERAHAALKVALPGFTFMHKLPRGAVIATAELVECWECSTKTACGNIRLRREASRSIYLGDVIELPCGSNEIHFGDFRLGRYAWELANVKLLPEPIPARGRQGLWEWRAA
jgi:hypothetical protein